MTMEILKFMSSTFGRFARIVAGIVLVIVGIALGGGWLALSLVGLVALLAGALDVCLFAPLFGQPLKDKAIR
jgi:hypothetical protein